MTPADIREERARTQQREKRKAEQLSLMQECIACITMDQRFPPDLSA